MSPLRVSSVALPIEFGDEASNFAAAHAALQRSEPGLIVLPELATSGYVFRDIDEARALSMTVDDPRLTGLADAVPEGAVAVIGFCERVGEQLFNSALVFDRSGTLGCYRKAHLWDEEYRFFSLGDEAGMVLDTPIGRLGVAICYDIEFPEVPRRLALAGAEVLALPVNWPQAERPAGEHAPRPSRRWPRRGPRACRSRSPTGTAPNAGCNGPAAPPSSTATAGSSRRPMNTAWHPRW